MAKPRASIIVIEGFYADAEKIRRHALGLTYYTPYEDAAEVRSGKARATWWASVFGEFGDCPFKSSQLLVSALEQAVGETVDLDHWRARFPITAEGKPLSGHHPRTCLWNCSFHVKPENGQNLGDGVHNHVTDSWNSVGPDGWAGIIYLSPAAPLDGGLHLWRNHDPAKQFDWMTPAKNWELVDSLGNVFNRLVLVRGDIPHSGAAGWGSSLDTGRLFQTFFFRTHPRKNLWPVTIPTAVPLHARTKGDP